MRANRINKLATGWLYRNPQPHVRSVHAYFPSIAALPDGQMLAAAVLGEAFEAVNLRTNLFRSRRPGRDLAEAEGMLHAGASGRVTSECARLTALPDGGLAAYMVRHDRTDHPDAGLTNPATLGFVPTGLWLLRSADAGKNLDCPANHQPGRWLARLSKCSPPITVLRDGRWLIPTHTWPDWDGHCPNGLQMIALVSRDQGRTWPEYWKVMSDPAGRVYFWESKIAELPEGRLLATAWVYDDQAKSDRPNHYALSEDGQNWSAPLPPACRARR